MVPSEDDQEQLAGGTESEHSSRDIEMDENMEWAEEEKMEEEDVQNAWFSQWMQSAEIGVSQNSQQEEPPDSWQ